MNAAWRLLDRGTGRVVVEQLKIADDYWSRLVGWQFRGTPRRGSGLLLAPCSSIHTFFVRFALDLVMLDREGRVLEVRRDVRPWRAVLPTDPTCAILEVPSSHDLDVAVGQSLGLVARAGGSPRLSKVLADWALGPSP